MPTAEEIRGAEKQLEDADIKFHTPVRYEFHFSASPQTLYYPDGSSRTVFGRQTLVPGGFVTDSRYDILTKDLGLEDGPKQSLTADGQSVNVSLANGYTVRIPRPANTEWCEIHRALREAGTPCIDCEQSAPSFRITDTRRAHKTCAICGAKYEIEEHMPGCGKMQDLDYLFTPREV